MKCYEMRSDFGGHSFVGKETDTHKYGHRVLVVPVLPENPSSSWTDNDEVAGGDTDVELESYDDLVHDYLQLTADNREFASSVDADLALEILGIHIYQLYSRRAVLLPV